MIAAVYARKSTDDSGRNAEARSTQRQNDSARIYAQAKGWTVDERFIYVDENTSGAEWKHRPGFNALLAAVEAPARRPSASSSSRSCRVSAAIPYARRPP